MKWTIWSTPNTIDCVQWQLQLESVATVPEYEDDDLVVHKMKKIHTFEAPTYGAASRYYLNFMDEWK